MYSSTKVLLASHALRSASDNRSPIPFGASTDICWSNLDLARQISFQRWMMFLLSRLYLLQALSRATTNASAVDIPPSTQNISSCHRDSLHFFLSGTVENKWKASGCSVLRYSCKISSPVKG